MSSSSSSSNAPAAAASSTTTSSRITNTATGNNHGMLLYGFCCTTCGTMEGCLHKQWIGQSIIINPTHDGRTNQELQTITQDEREIVWSDMTANSETSFYGHANGRGRRPRGGGGGDGSRTAASTTTNAPASSRANHNSRCGENVQFNPTQEEPYEFVTQCLSQLDEELERLTISQDTTTTTTSKSSSSNNGGKLGGGKTAGSAYCHVMNTHPEYVNNRRFKVMFLRADRFNPQAAAKRILAHFEYKLELFGIDKLHLDLTMDDLSEEEREIYQRDESFRFLPLDTKDHAGRNILFDRPGKVNFDCWKSEVRAYICIVLTYVVGLLARRVVEGYIPVIHTPLTMPSVRATHYDSSLSLSLLLSRTHHHPPTRNIHTYVPAEKIFPFLRQKSIKD